MIISYAHRFIFLRPAKVGSTSVQQTLATGLCGPDDLVSAAWLTEEQVRRFRPGRVREVGAEPQNVTPPEFKGRRRYTVMLPGLYGIHEHTRPGTIQQIDPSAWAQFRKVTIARNPWELVLSKINHKRRVEEPDDVDAWLRKHFREAARELCLNDRTLDVYTSMYFDSDGEELCDVVLRHESLEVDFHNFCGVELKHRLRAFNDRTGHYTEYYDERTRDIVHARFAKEIDAFGYEFGA